MSIPIIRMKAPPRTVIKGKMDARFPASVVAMSPLTLDRAGGNYTFGFDMNAAVDALSYTFEPKISYPGDEGVFLDGTGNFSAPAGDGDVKGPASAVDGTPAVFDGTTGKLLKNITYSAFKTLLSLVKADVGLGNVDNTSDATKNSASATLTNKTIDTAGPNTIKVNGNALSASSGTATVTLPNSTDTIVGRATTDTLTNKTLTSPVINGATGSAASSFTATTQSARDNSTKLATTAYVDGATREKLTANRTYYIRTDGSDSNNGLSNTSGGAFLTIQKAYNVILTLDLNGFSVTIQLATGTYAGLNQTASPVGGNVAITGDTVTPANTIISDSTQPAIGLVSPINLTLSGLTLQTSGSANNRCISAAAAGVNVSIGPSMVFGSCSGSHIFSNRNALVSLDNDYTINGNATRHYVAGQGGVISGTGKTVTVSGTPAFSTAFAESTLSGVIQAPNMTYSGSATGSRYNAASGGVINTGSGNTSYFPGNAAGTGTNAGTSPYGLYL